MATRTVYLITAVSASDWTFFFTGSLSRRKVWSNERPDAAEYLTKRSAQIALGMLRQQQPDNKTFFEAGVSADEIESEF